MVVHLVLTAEEGTWVAQSLEFDVASQGETPQEAIEMWREAASLYVEELGHLPEWQTVEVEFDARTAAAPA